ncbi:MAG: V-type ATP synthase subunit K [Ruminococcaceae bacterium]|nr:V-type ATP synthase subunit K [Oscillospiraceae bacterium]
MTFNLGMLGIALAMGIAATGSAIGIGIAGQAAIGAWKRCYMNNKAAPFILTVFAGAPLTQTIYGFLLMQTMMGSSADPMFLLGLGIASGFAMAMSAVVQGKAGAAGADALGDTGKGFSQYIMVVGLCETVALFALVFSMVALA